MKQEEMKTYKYLKKKKEKELPKGNIEEIIKSSIILKKALGGFLSEIEKLADKRVLPSIKDIPSICPHCSNIFYIPLLKIQKITNFNCKNCGRELEIESCFAFTK